MGFRFFSKDRMSWAVAMAIISSFVASPCLGKDEKTHDPEPCVLRLLGEGLGGIVHHVRDANGTEYVSKLYNSWIKFNRDYQLMIRLRKYVHTDSDPNGFRVVRVWIVRRSKKAQTKGPFEMNLDYEDGRSLHSILVDPTIPESEKQRLRNLYKENLRIFDARLGKHGLLKRVEFKYASAFFQDNEYDGLPVRTYSVIGHADEEPETALIKSDNVIVDRRTGRMTIVDPY